MSASNLRTSPTKNGTAENLVEPPVKSGSPEPLLQPGSSRTTDTGAESSEIPHPEMEFEPGTVIEAQPISIVPPEDWYETAKTPARKNPEERPDWLPEDWTMDRVVRTSGATAGQFDRYYLPPTGGGRFRSRSEVVHFLETGTKRKPGKSDVSGKSKKKMKGKETGV